ncbi:MAG: branched-chain amino acid ABC transporter permease [Burkholderiales bacterium]
MKRMKMIKLGIAGAVGLIFLTLPLYAGNFYLQFVTKMCIMAIFAMSLNLLVGVTGLVSLGHAAFFGVAGYALAMVSPESSAASIWWTLPFALGVSALSALAIGFLVLRTSGAYFIMATLAFAQMLYFFIHDSPYAGGSDGKYIYFKPSAAIGSLAPFNLENKIHFYYVALVCLVLVFVGLMFMLRSTFGHALRGIKVNEHRMRSLGFHTFRYKLACFVIAGTLAGLAGYLSASQFGFVNPEMLAWHQSGNVLMMVILGGISSMNGAIIGAFTLLALEEVLSQLTEHWLLYLGMIIVAVVMLLPNGLLGLLQRRRKDGAGHE